MQTSHFPRMGGTTGFQRVSGPITLDNLRARVPSAFAPGKHLSRSERYTYIPTSEVIEGMYKAGFLPFQARQGGSRIEGKEAYTKHMLRFRHHDLLAEQRSVEHVPEIVLINSHDGTSAYKIMAGIFRLVCVNGLIIADSTIASISIQHKGDVVRSVVDASLKIIEATPQAAAQIAAWRQVRLTPSEQMILAEEAHGLRFERDEAGNSTAPISPAQLLAPRREADEGNSLWLTLNRVQEHVIRGGDMGRVAPIQPRRRPRTVTTRPVKGIDGDVRLNRALWSLAEKMAKLKQLDAAA
jgi:hypothetical protein